MNDGMYPAGHDHGGVVQGIPVAIGTGRKHRREFDHDHDIDGSGSGSSGGGSVCGSQSGGSSPIRVGEMR